ncbi:MAG: hypothetical protein GF317_11525 [Candidatus Lokiarchaeota archaeon]|nr:hypothetical protein [Candidatus Lokiarchaeota archaeon]MBD3200281.1 hypothetical protein [Candidatus Lokiarchaeota archaeon]
MISIKKNFVFQFLFSLILFTSSIFFIGTILPNNEILNNEKSYYKPPLTLKYSGTWNLSHIHINNNWSLTEQEEWCYKINDVYIIENVSIDAKNVGHGILIENSTLAFIIRNCTIVNSGLGTDDSGILLYNTSNGFLYRNTLLGNSRGIYLHDYSMNNTISENYISNCSSSIKFENLCNKNKIHNNTIYNNLDGIHLIAACCQNIISNNQIDRNEWGIVLADYPFDSFLSSDRNIIRNNKITSCKIGGNGITIYDCSHNLILNNEIINCTGTFDMNGNGIMFETSTMISTISQNNSIIGNTIIENNHGILSYTLSETKYNNTFISNNTILYNENEAIEITYHDYLNISNNHIEKNGWFNALTLKNGDYCYFYNNNISNNFDTGATISAYQTLTFINNYFENNSLGLFLTTMEKAIISNNTFINNFWMAGWFSGVSWLKCEYNHFKYNKYGLNISSEGKLIFSENLISDNIDGGLWINNHDAQIYLIKNYIWKNGGDNIDAQIILVGGQSYLINNSIGCKMDTDNDGLTDYDEITKYFTNHFNIDTDLDNLNDAFEIKYGTDPCDDDSDGDGYYDGIEILSNTNPLDPNDYPGNGAPSSDPLLLLYIAMISAAIIITGIVSTILYTKLKK